MKKRKIIFLVTLTALIGIVIASVVYAKQIDQKKKTDNGQSCYTPQGYPSTYIICKSQ